MKAVCALGTKRSIEARVLLALSRSVSPVVTGMWTLVAAPWRLPAACAVDREARPRYLGSQRRVLRAESLGH